MVHDMTGSGNRNNSTTEANIPAVGHKTGARRCSERQDIDATDMTARQYVVDCSIALC